MRRGPPGLLLLLLLLLLLALPAGPRGPGAAPEGCGRRPLSASAGGSRVVGGQHAARGAWPWAVSLQARHGGAGLTHVCGGVLVSESAVLTAGHCVPGKKDPHSWRAVLGVRHLREQSKHAARIKIRSITVHPGFQAETFENDIALFRLRSAVRYSDYIQPVCLPRPPLRPQEMECFISGWGRTSEAGKKSDVLKEARVEIIPYSICNGSSVYSGLISNNMICAGSLSGGIDSCQGDSGGPLACYDPSTQKYYLLGLASFGYGCGRPNYPGVYVRVSQYRAWIKSEILRSEAASPASVALGILLTAIPMALV